jgi:hypothetical protein
VDRANENQGAESTLAWLGALVDMTSVARTIREPRTPAAQPHRTARPSGSPCT